MKKTLKKTLALVLSMLMLLSVFSVASGAVKLSEGLDALRAQWSRDCGPSAGGYAIDYSYYSPVKSASDSTKYPLVVFLPGGGEGKKPGGELTGNSFARWSSEELQARFTSSGGAFLMIARDPEEKLLYWDASSLIPGLKAAIDDFAQKHPNVDTSRIYVIGWCLGATGALNLAVNYSNSIAGVVLCSPRCSISSSDAVKLKNTAAWILSCKKDSYSLYSYSQTSWSNLKENSADKSKIRFTSFDSAPNAGGLLQHLTWKYVETDTEDQNGYEGIKTVDGNGNSVSIDASMIKWLSSQYLHYDTPDCSCNCHKTGVVKFIWKIQVIFWKLFGVRDKKVCDCGVSHW